MTVVLGVQVCDHTGDATAANAVATASANKRDLGSVFGDASAPPTTPPLGALANSDATCNTPNVRLKTMR
jgi:hypothetical protein